LLQKLVGKEINISTAQQHYEQKVAIHASVPLFGPSAPKAKQHKALEAQIHALLHSNSSKVPGFSQLVSMLQAPNAGGAVEGFDSPLLRLLRRVSLWWYYRVMFDPLEQLVALSSSYEQLFQLMTPHQQLSCMADILLVLACPVLHEHRYALFPAACMKVKLVSPDSAGTCFKMVVLHAACRLVTTAPVVTSVT
jgi:hypothetical protein